MNAIKEESINKLEELKSRLNKAVNTNNLLSEKVIELSKELDTEISKAMKNKLGDDEKIQNKKTYKKNL